MPEEKKLSHIGERGQLHMVDVSQKNSTMRKAVAESRVILPEALLDNLYNGELTVAKGPVFQTAIIAGIMAAKRTGELIPLCHPLGLDEVNVGIEIIGREVVITGTAKVSGKTGVEMEALTAVSLAALTIYDMCKSYSHDIVIKEIRLMEKSGGKNDFRRKV